MFTLQDCPLLQSTSVFSWQMKRIPTMMSSMTYMQDCRLVHVTVMVFTFESCSIVSTEYYQHSKGEGLAG